MEIKLYKFDYETKYERGTNISFIELSESNINFLMWLRDEGLLYDDDIMLTPIDKIEIVKF